MKVEKESRQKGNIDKAMEIRKCMDKRGGEWLVKVQSRWQ